MGLHRLDRRRVCALRPDGHGLSGGGRPGSRARPRRRRAGAAGTNAFLALTDIVKGSMHPGYIVTPASVTLGITRAGKTGYGLIPLQPGGTGPGDWDTEPGCFGFPEISGYTSLCGTMLIDTGINSAILGLPPSQRPPGIQDVLPAGARFSSPHRTRRHPSRPTPSPPARSGLPPRARSGGPAALRRSSIPAET